MEIDAELAEQTDALGARAGGRSRGAPPWGAWGMPPRARAPRCADGSEVWAKAGDLATAHPQLADTLKGLFPQGYVGKWIWGKATRSDGQLGSSPAWLVRFASIDHDVRVRRSTFQTSAPAAPSNAIYSGPGDASTSGASVTTTSTITSTMDATADPPPPPPPPQQQQQQQQPQQPQPQPDANVIDTVMVGDVAWAFHDIGTTDECRPSLPEAAAHPHRAHTLARHSTWCWLSWALLSVCFRVVKNV